jgi:ribosome biogenesis protein Tsr3
MAKDPVKAQMVEALKAALALWDNGHALSRFNWGTSFLRAQDIRELNELPIKLRAAIKAAKKRN